MANKKYFRTIFSGKSVPFSGMKEGEGILYRSNSVPFCMNLLTDGAIGTRIGQKHKEKYAGVIRLGSDKAIVEGGNFWIAR